MEKPDLYLETTIISYLTAKRSRDIVILAHQEITSNWWENYRNNFNIYTSEIVISEADQGDKKASERRMSLLSSIPVLQYNADVERLARLYFAELSFPDKALADTFHLAFSVHYRMDYLLTWNCAHLANEVLQRRLIKLNERSQLDTPFIITPEEFLAITEEE